MWSAMGDDRYFGRAKMIKNKRRMYSSCVVALLGMIVFAIEAFLSKTPTIGFLIFLVGALLMTWNLASMYTVMIRAVRHDKPNTRTNSGYLNGSDNDAPLKGE